jgi:hypothetical protein
MQELYAMRPLWETPIDLGNTRLVQLLGEEPHTRLDSPWKPHCAVWVAFSE